MPINRFTAVEDAVPTRRVRDENLSANREEAANENSPTWHALLSRCEYKVSRAVTRGISNKDIAREPRRRSSSICAPRFALSARTAAPKRQCWRPRRPLRERSGALSSVRDEDGGQPMRQELIFAPMGALALLTFVVLALVPVVRVTSGIQRTTTPQDFSLGESQRVPSFVAIPNRNYMNLLELPVLFYVICLMNYASHGVDRITLLLAWTFVAIRVTHSLIHLTINAVGLRAIVFGIGAVPVGLMWIVFLMKEFPGGLSAVFQY